MQRMLKTILLSVLLVAVLAPEAAAWGPDAERAIAATSFQVVRRTWSKAFRGDLSNYENDVILGMNHGPAALGDHGRVASAQHAFALVDDQVALLREVRQYGLGSYMSYRLGVLGSLCADLVLPFGLDVPGRDLAIQERVFADIDRQIAEGNIRYRPSHADRQTIINAREYFVSLTGFFDQAEMLIRDDYGSARGYDGFLAQATERYFSRAVDAVADAWHTVMVARDDARFGTPSRQQLTWYFVREIEYLLTEKGNVKEARRALEVLQDINPGILEAYEEVGDLFYGFGQRELAVEQWLVAFEGPGAQRRRAARKIARHYVTLGQDSLAAAEEATGEDTHLNDAESVFSTALQYDPANTRAADLLSDTRTAIREREARRNQMIGYIAAGEQVMAEAERNYMRTRDHEHAIRTYERAIDLFQLVDDEFPTLQDDAQRNIQSVRARINEVINNVFTIVENLIEEGDNQLRMRNFDQAIEAYERVEDIVRVVPGDEHTTHGQERIDKIREAEEKIEEAQRQKRQAELQQQQPGAPGPGMPGPGAPGPGAPGPGMPGPGMPGPGMPGPGGGL